MSQQNVELFRQALDAFNRRDRDAWLALCEPDFENAPPSDWPESAPMRGREAIWDFFVSNMDPWEESRFEFGELIDAGERVVAEQHATVRGKSSGARVAWSYWHVLTVRDGRAVRSDWFITRAEALAAAGLGG
jgi:ketosteroid isomerase-like protein